MPVQFSFFLQKAEVLASKREHGSFQSAENAATEGAVLRHRNRSETVDADLCRKYALFDWRSELCLLCRDRLRLDVAAAALSWRWMAHSEPEAAGDSQNGPLTIPLMAIREVFRKERSRASSRSPLRIIAFCS